MKLKTFARFCICVAGLYVVSFSNGLGTAVAQQADDDETSRQIFAAEFLNTRPPSKTRRPPAPPTNKPTVPLATDLVGITLWRLRPATSTDDTQARLLDHESDSDAQLIAERISLDTVLKEGQKVRLSVESPRTGYLYVIDREQYADGTFSDPYLIFPTLKIRDGDNAITAGRLIEFPDQGDRPVYFKMKRSRQDQVAEVLTVLVTSQPIPNLQIGRRPLKLTNEQFAKWEAWKAPSKRVELAQHPGKAYTKAEQSAGANPHTLLDRDDPLPQSVFRVSAKQGNPILLNISLKYEAPK